MLDAVSASLIIRAGAIHRVKMPMQEIAGASLGAAEEGAFSFIRFRLQESSQGWA